MKRFIPQGLHQINRASWVALAVSLVLVLATNYALYVQACKLGEKQFELNVKEVAQAIDERMRQHAQILLGGAGLFNASATVDRLAWQRYVETLRLDQFSQGVQGVGYSEIIAQENLGRRSLALQAQGSPDFEVHPAGTRAVYSAIVYLEPLTQRNQHGIGYDMLTDPNRAQAMRRAADSGMPTLSEKVDLLLETEANKKIGVLMHMPVYRKQQSLATPQDRWQALQGFVFIPLRVQDLMRGLLGERERPLKFQIYDGLQATPPQAATLLFDSDRVTHLGPQSKAQAQWTTSRVISAYGRDWTVQFQSQPAIETAWLTWQNASMLVMGVGLSIVLFLFMATLNSRRVQAEIIARDMTTELRSQTQELQRSQHLLDAIVENIPAGVFVKDVQNFRYELVNRAWRQMNECTGQSLIGKTAHEVFGPALADRFSANDDKVISSGQIFVGEEVRRHTPLGQERVLRTLKVGIPNEAGNTSHLLGISIDLTEQVAARMAMKESVQLMQAVFDNVADGIITLDQERRIQSMNRSAELMFGYALTEVQGQPFNMLSPQDHHARMDEFLDKEYHFVSSDRLGHYHEVEGRGKDGHIFSMDLAISGSTHQGQPLIVCLVRDISERKKSEQMKASFVSTVSHELRTPLTSINGALGLVCGGVLGETPPQVRAMLDMAYKNSQRLTLLINDLLDLEKIAAGKMRMDLALEELTPLLVQAIAAAEVYAQRQQVQLRLDTPSEPVRVRVDANRLQQVLGNLLSNAVKYSTPGDQVEVSVSICPENGVVRVSVTDHGPGIPTEFRARIFQKFSQADTSDTRQKGGSGLGLAISQELMERMNGLIGYESVPGQGASFHLMLPVWVESDKQPDTATRPSGAQGSGSARILVVEDNPVAASALVEILHGAGYGVDVAISGAMALERVQTNSYVAITLDMVLPDQTGVSLVRVLRARTELDAVPIVVISTATEMGKLALQNEFSAIEWLNKPVDGVQLLGILKRRLAATTPTNSTEAIYET